MKKIINLFLISALIFAYSCTKQETVAYYTGGTAPVITGNANSGGSVINLNATDSATTAILLSWTNPNYTFNYGVSSINVGYLVEIDTSGSNFTNPQRAQIGISQSTNLALPESVINAYLTNQMGLDTSLAHSLQIRVLAYMVTSGPGADTMTSNVLDYTAKPYFPPPTVAPPSSYPDNPNGDLYIVGSAVDATNGWNNPVWNTALQHFTQITPTDYQLTIPLIGDGEYKLIGVNGSWNDQWSIQNEQNSGDPSTLSYTLYFNGANVRAPLQSGTYLIDVDFQHGKVTLTLQ
jgi:hypothetical protein